MSVETCGVVPQSIRIIVSLKAPHLRVAYIRFSPPG